MKNIKKLAVIFFILILVTGCGVEKHITENTPEYYYLPELAMKEAKKTKQITTIYFASDEFDYATIPDLKNAVEPGEDKTVLECDFKNKTSQEYTLTKNGEKIGVIDYTYRYDQNEKYIISKVGDNMFREFVFADGKLAGINDYVGTEKTADSVAISTRLFQYAANGVCVSNIVDTIDNSGAPIQYRYNFQYYDGGQIARINTVGIDADGKEMIVGHINFEYNDENLMTSATYFAAVGEEERIVSHYEYEYE